ncbi:S26 family signal peptidase [Candidatus Woesearchaeota archaeon]|nr:S26 family signal peptidase [Candidatus Woesearchaeota archaeon]
MLGLIEKFVTLVRDQILSAPQESKVSHIDSKVLRIESILEDIETINNELKPFKKRLVLVSEGQDLASPAPRVANDHQFTKALGQRIATHYKGFLIDVKDSNSMDPWIDAGHKAVMIPFQTNSPFRTKDLVVGDIVMFDRSIDGAKNVLHRIVAIDKAGFVLTQGDNTVVVDGKTVSSDLKYLCVGVLY